MLNRGLSKEIDDILGRELRGKLNESLLLILLIKNYEAWEESKKAKPLRFRNKSQRVIKEGITTRALADELDMPQSTVATAVSRLLKSGYVTHSKGMPVKTTETGREVAYEHLKHHRLLEIMLVNSLGMDIDDAHNESVKLMLLASCELIEIIRKRYNDPENCPCGEKIPSSNLCEIEANKTKENIEVIS